MKLNSDDWFIIIMVTLLVIGIASDLILKLHKI